MKKFWLIPILLLVIFLIKTMEFKNVNAQTTLPQSSKEVVFKVDDQPTFHNEFRVGINLGDRSTWGSSQYMTNMLTNPGFEGRIDRLVIIVSKSDEKSFSDEGWGAPDGSWNGAAFEVRTGKSAGAKGTIIKSLQETKESKPQYFTEGPTPPLSPKDVIILTKYSTKNPDPKNPVPQWWFMNPDLVAVDPFQTRPGSPGKQSAKLTATEDRFAELDFSLDAITDRAGKLLLVQGPWRLSMWLKGESSDDSLHVHFYRLNGSPDFFNEKIDLTPYWKEYTFDFNAEDNGRPQVIKLALTAPSSNLGSVWIDDIWLGPMQQRNFPFREEFIHVLKDLHPSFIRENFSNGDTMENHVAEPWARKPWDTGGEQTTYGYSLPELLDLCQLVGANPWLIIPTTFSDDELHAYGKFLAQNANKSRFSEVIVEFGNENWNWLFRPLGFPYPDVNGLMAENAFKIIAAATGKDVNLRKVIGGQAVNPAYSMEYLKHDLSADTIAIAPYLLDKLDKGTPPNIALQQLFQNDGGFTAQTYAEARRLNKTMAIYEVNLGTVNGNAPPSERDPVVAGAAAGAALAKRILECMMDGANPVMIFLLSQYDTNMGDNKQFVKLWGITRDLGVTGRYRPQGLAMKLLNRVIGGDLYKVHPIHSATKESEHLTIVAFKTEGGWTAAAVSANPTPVTVSIQFPNDNLSIPASMHEIQASSPFDTNEEEEKVKIAAKTVFTNDRTITFTIPAWGLAVLGNSSLRSIPSSPQSIETQ
jgi:hypothetical protein